MVPDQINVTVENSITTEDGVTGSFSVVLTSEPEDDVTITFNSDDDSEGTPDNASLVFTPENWSTAQTVIVTGADDSG